MKLACLILPIAFLFSSVLPGDASESGLRGYTTTFRFVDCDNQPVKRLKIGILLRDGQRESSVTDENGEASFSHHRSEIISLEPKFNGRTPEACTQAGDVTTCIITICSRR